MGIYKRLYHGNKCIANLGRAYHYEDEYDSDYIMHLKLELFAAARTPITEDNVSNIVGTYESTLDAIIDHYQAKARNDLINTILQDGALTVRDE